MNASGDVDLDAELSNARLPLQTPPPPVLDARIRAAIAADLKPKHVLSRPTRIALGFGAALSVMVVVWLFRGGQTLPAGQWLALVFWASIVLAALLLGLPRRNAGQAQAISRWAVLLVPLGFFTYLATVSTGFDSLANVLFGGDAVPHAARCGVGSTALGTLAAATLFVLWRRTDPFHPALTGALAGVLGGVAGAIAIGLVCPGQEGFHLWLGHGLVLLLLGALGALLGRRLLAP